MNLSCFIVDDEPLAIEVLESHIEKIDHLEIEGTFNNAVKAFEALQEQEIDLLFLDIQMPRLTGIELLKTLRHTPKVIFTTAYREYAIEGFELDVVDYLLKPIPFERFLKAINKVYALEKRNGTVSSRAGHTGDEERYLFVQVDKRMVKIQLNDIRYIESRRDYVKIITDNKEILAHQKISYLEERLSEDQFLRIHRSFIISLPRIESWSSSEIEIAGTELPIGRTYKNQVMEILEERSNIL